MTAIPVIAIVDDDPAVRMALGRLLRSIDLDVRLYDKGESLLDDAGAPALDCIVTDVRMPGVSGFDLCSALRRRGMDMPVIFMTAFAQDGFASRAEQAGATCIIQKPFAATELLSCIERALGREADRG
ncbi:response regulator transcription factor [Bordetella genomosp. 13]|uniref:Response regulator n=1 Tax=Bordetella genomosp. 13 TaxID=463040 RepID=A0A1W6ZFX2_9BORD|nr:response regulator [Bordetella genomosp. 13]ARP96040.1 response regulator [Bordetella genomosp. 13]